LAGLPSPGIQAAAGRVAWLRVHDGGFGPPNDFLDSEVVFILDTQPGRGFGVNLNSPAHEAMRALLQDAFIHNLTVGIEYNQVEGKRNAKAFRVSVGTPV
jgi:hypothetical protein